MEINHSAYNNTDLWDHVFDYLDISDIVNCVKVCKSWRYFILHYQRRFFWGSNQFLFMIKRPTFADSVCRTLLKFLDDHPFYTKLSSKLKKGKNPLEVFKKYIPFPSWNGMQISDAYSQYIKKSIHHLLNLYFPPSDMTRVIGTLDPTQDYDDRGNITYMLNKIIYLYMATLIYAHGYIPETKNSTSLPPHQD